MLNGKKKELLWQGGSLEQFIEKIKKDFGIEGEVVISFQDIDKETIKVMDSYDFDYMISNISDENELSIEITGKEKVPEPFMMKKVKKGSGEKKKSEGNYQIFNKKEEP